MKFPPWLRLLFSAALLVAIALLVDVGATLSVLARASAPLLPLLLLVNTVAYVLFALRWRYFCGRLGLPMGFRSALAGVYLFQVTAQVMPSPLLGEAARFAVFPAATAKAAILKSIALDRLANQLSLIALVTVLLPYYWRRGYPDWLRTLLPLPAIVLAALLVVSWLVARRLRGGALGERLAFLGLLVRDRRSAYPLGLGVALSLVLGLQFYLAAAALPVAGPVGADVVLLVPLLTLWVSLLPISFADWGTREAVAIVVLQPTGLPVENLLAISLLVGVVNLLCSLPGLVLWARRGAGSGCA